MNSIIELDTLVSNLENSSKHYFIWRLQEGESLLVVNELEVSEGGIVVRKLSNGNLVEVKTTRIIGDMFVGIIPSDPAKPQCKQIAIVTECDFSTLPDMFSSDGVWIFDREITFKNSEAVNKFGFGLFCYVLSNDNPVTNDFSEQCSSSDPEVGRKMVLDRAINDLESDVASLKVTNNIIVIKDLLERINRSTNVINSYYENDIDDYMRDNDRGRGRSRNRRL